MLRELQRDFAEALYAENPEGEEVVLAAGKLDPMPRLTGAQGLGIYRNSLANGMTESLAEIFPVCAELVGPDCFRSVAHLYLRAAPSLHADLARVGDGWPEFVEGLAFLSEVSYLADVARLELGLHHAHAAPGPSVQHDPGELGEAISENPEAWRFLLPPSATLLDSPHPALTLWEAHQDRRVDRGWTLDPQAPGEQIIVFRARSEIHADLVEPSLWPILVSISAGEPVAKQLQLAGALRSSEGSVPVSAVNPGDNVPILTTIRVLFERGWVVGGSPM